MNNNIRYLVERLFDNNDELLTNDELTLDELNIADNINCQKYVDLGLPSGTLWCTHNIGAKNIEDPGDYYDYNDFIIKNKEEELPKYSDLLEFKYNINVEKDDNGVYCISKINGNKIFIPYSGYYYLDMFLNSNKAFLGTFGNTTVKYRLCIECSENLVCSSSRLSKLAKIPVRLIKKTKLSYE